MLHNNIYLVLVTQKCGFAVDEHAAANDKMVLPRESIPSWMDFHTLYFFKFTDFNDDSETTKKVPAMYPQKRHQTHLHDPKEAQTNDA